MSPAAPARALAAAKAARKAEIERRIYSGVMRHRGRDWQVGPHAQRAILAAALEAQVSLADPAAHPWPADFAWIDRANRAAPMTAAAMLALALAMSRRKRRRRSNARRLKDAVDACATVEAVAAIDITRGW